MKKMRKMGRLKNDLFGIVYRKNDPDILFKLQIIWTDLYPVNIEEISYRLNPPSNAGINRIYSRVRNNTLYLKVFLSRPGIFIGRRGETIEKIKEQLTEMYPHVECTEILLVEYNLYYGSSRKKNDHIISRIINRFFDNKWNKIVNKLGIK